MKTLGNILWLLFGGLFAAISNFFLGVLLCITIIGIPFGKQCFKFATLMLSPFGKEVKLNFDAHPIANIIWLIFVGFAEGISYYITGIILCITIIGIPFGKQWFKIGRLMFIPFGASIENAD